MNILKKNQQNRVNSATIVNGDTLLLLYKYINFNLYSLFAENRGTDFVSKYLNAYLPSDLRNKCISSYNNYYKKINFKCECKVSDIAGILPDGNINIFCENLESGQREIYYYNLKNDIIIHFLYIATIIHTKSNLLLAFGGYKRDMFEIFDSIKIFSIQENTWKTLNSKLIIARTNHVLVEMLDGQILIIGGTNYKSIVNNFCVECELYNPKTDTIKQVGSLNIARRNGHSGCLLPNGCVLVSGGYIIKKNNKKNNNNNKLYCCTDSCEIYNPVTDLWTIVKPMKTLRVNHYTFVLNNKQVAIFECGEYCDEYCDEIYTF